MDNLKQLTMIQDKLSNIKADFTGMSGLGMHRDANVVEAKAMIIYCERKINKLIKGIGYESKT